MTDIVERLRELPTMSIFANIGDLVGRLNHEREEAANEIERLRATLDQTRRFALNGEMDTIVSDEIERLREALQRLAELDEFVCGKPQTIEEVMNYTQFVARAALEQAQPVAAGEKE